jgi:uncharacterized protein YecE (DUF72 family)
MGAEIRVGCSGWQYRHWRGDFYPAELPTDRWLGHYAAIFDTVELNNSFYRLPPASAFAAWGRRVPARFRFAVKASRYLTHLRKLREPDEPLERLWSHARHLGDRLGPMLYQLPPHWNRDPERLVAFLERVPSRRAQAIEFRDRSWYDPAIYDLLERHGVALCLHDMSGSASDVRPVGPFVYLRLHGSGARYGGRYPDEVLERWAERLIGWSSDGLRCWVYFNNDVGGHAPRDALRLRAMLGHDVPTTDTWEPAAAGYSAKKGSSP